MAPQVQRGDCALHNLLTSNRCAIQCELPRFSPTHDGRITNGIKLVQPPNNCDEAGWALKYALVEMQKAVSVVPLDSEFILACCVRFVQEEISNHGAVCRLRLLIPAREANKD